MKRRAAAIVAAAAVLLGLSAFGVSRLLASHTAPAAGLTAKPTTCADAYRLTKLTPSQIKAGSQVCFAQSLRLSGQLNGSVAQAYQASSDSALPSQPCTEPARWAGYPQAMLAIAVDGKPYRLRISPPGRSEHQALTLSDLGQSVGLASILDPAQDWNQVTGSVTVNADGVTGTLSVDALQDVAGATPVHISGQWACGTPPVLASPDPTVPCSSFYVLNQLQPSDVARMKANGCHAEDLTFSGDISAHVDQGVNDAAYEYDQGVNGDNLCGQAFGQYGATIKFSVGDETFQLNLAAFDSPSVGPGQHPAGNQSQSFAAIYLGYADASRHGVFVQSSDVYWYANAGTFTIGQDMKSGIIDADFAGPEFENFSHVRIIGSWRCAG
jgi:hypothetical protein